MNNGDHEIHLGENLRRARTGRNIGVRELARRIDVSASLISRIEKGTVTPSVATLFALQSALDVPMADLLGDGSAPAGDAGGRSTGDAVATPIAFHGGSRGVQRSDDRKVLDLGSGVHWEQLTPGPDPVEFTYNIYRPGGASCDEGALMRHSGREYGYVLSGRLSVTLGFETSDLEPGDSIAFDSSMPHRLFNAGETDVVAIWVVIGR